MNTTFLSRAYPAKPPIVIQERESEHTCSCGATFVSSSRTRVRCDACRGEHRCKVMQRAAKKLRAKRAKAKE